MSAPDGKDDVASEPSTLEGVEEDELNMNNAPRKYIPLANVYSASSIPEEKVERVPIGGEEDRRGYAHVYSRRQSRKRKRTLPFLDQILQDFPEGYDEDSEEDDRTGESKKRRIDRNGSEGKNSSRSNKRRKRGSLENGVDNSAGSSMKKSVCLSFQGVDPRKFIGLRCEVYWPLDARWYDGHISDFDSETGRHRVKYVDGEEEYLILSNERIKFYISFEEMQQKKLKVGGKRLEVDGIDVDELMILAASLDDSSEIETGDVIWAKLTGHAIWPAIVLDESHLRELKGLNRSFGEKSVPVQFFGTHDFARVRHKQVISFLKGLFSSYHRKCQKPTFLQGLVEAKMYLSEQRLPEIMLQLRGGIEADMDDSRSEEPDSAPTNDEESLSDEEIRKKLNDLKSVPLEAGSRSSLRFTCSSSKKTNHSSVGYRQVNVQWRDLDKCNVCHMDEEYENNLFLQCDKCRMMVHARCYGELEPTGGDLWLCNLCRPEAPEYPPRCCLCPVTGGAMKPTTDGRWAHLACAIWIPETCLADIKKMEPIDGLHRINKDRWKLLCSICNVSHGACIQCSNPNCRVAYHPLCARAAGFCLETEDMDSLHIIPFDEDEESQRIQLLSFCWKHRPSSSNEQSSLNRKIGQKASDNAKYVPPVNPSGCARTEPYNVLLRRGRKEPEVLAASSKRLYVESKPYLLGGSSPHMPLWNRSSDEFAASKNYLDLQKLRIRLLNPSREILSVADKYNYMRETFRKRLTFGKSGIHGYGVIAKLPHRAGDMVIEYTGELIRPRVADRREHLIYNSLVGAGTYMFRIDDNRVIDATRAGSIAHLINHSCEPNCYSRVIRVVGEDHIIIFAKRDIKQWEELTYDYRFVSVDERLPCYCGASRCLGIVNDTEAEERVGKLCVPCSEVVDWQGE